MEITISTYIILVKRGKLTIEQVPAQYRDEVAQAISKQIKRVVAKIKTLSRHSYYAYIILARLDYYKWLGLCYVRHRHLA